MREPEMAKTAAWIDEVVKAPEDDKTIARVAAEIRELCKGFPAPGIPVAG
jgi:glycine hydroxymethyltransferase